VKVGTTAPTVPAQSARPWPAQDPDRVLCDEELAAVFGRF